MTEKEKAKAYDEAIERAKKSYGNRIAEEIFPELKENDTERIRKNCIHFLELQKQHHAATFEIEECIDWLEKQGEQASSQNNERAWLYLVSDVLTWKDGIGQYLDNPIVQELAKRLCSDYAQKLYSPSNSSNTGKNEQKSSDKIEQKFHKGDWITIDKPCQIINIHDNGNYIVQYCDDEKTYELSKNFCESYFHFWTIQDAKDSDVLSFYSDYKGKKMFQTGIIEKNVGKLGGCYNIFKTYVGMDWDNNLHIGRYMGCDDIQPATKEQRDALMKAISDAEYEWDIEKKELKKKRKR